MLRTNLISTWVEELLVSIESIPLCCFYLICFNLFASAFFTMITCLFDDNLEFKSIFDEDRDLSLCFFPFVWDARADGGSKVDSAFHPPEVDRMSTRNFWELSGKK